MFKLPIRKQTTVANGKITCSEHLAKQKTQSHIYKITRWKRPSNLSQFNHIISEMRGEKAQGAVTCFFKKNTKSHAEARTRVLPLILGYAEIRQFSPILRNNYAWDLFSFSGF